jgi:hypothetical protein
MNRKSLNRKSLLAVAAALAAATLSACGGSSMSSLAAPMAPAPPAATAPASTDMVLNATQLLEQARKSSETASPLPVDGGALRLDDTSDTSEPISVDES